MVNALSHMMKSIWLLTCIQMLRGTGQTKRMLLISIWSPASFRCSPSISNNWEMLWTNISCCSWTAAKISAKESILLCFVFNIFPCLTFVLLWKLTVGGGWCHRSLCNQSSVKKLSVYNFSQFNSTKSEVERAYGACLNLTSWFRGRGGHLSNSSGKIRTVLFCLRNVCRPTHGTDPDQSSFFSLKFHLSDCRLPSCDTEVFSGDYLGWPTFRDLFTAVYMDNPRLIAVEKLFHLNSKNSGGESDNLLLVPTNNKFIQYEGSSNTKKLRFVF